MLVWKRLNQAIHTVMHGQGESSSTIMRAGTFMLDVKPESNLFMHHQLIQIKRYHQHLVESALPLVLVSRSILCAFVFGTIFLPVAVFPVP